MSVDFEKRGPYAVIQINRPEARNAVNAAVAQGIEDAIDQIEADEAVWVGILTGVPPVFSAGADLKEINSGNAAGLQTQRGGFAGIATRERTKPIIAAVDGPALGIGTTMLFLCDYVVASEWSAFGADHVSLGLPLDAGSSLLGPEMLGHHFAFELLVAGESMDAHRAMQAGLVNRVVEPELVEETARIVAERIASQPPEAVRLAKRMMVGDRRDVVTRITREASSLPALQNSPHASAALQERLKRGGA
jgi:enoyl-CoA hydratase